MTPDDLAAIVARDNKADETIRERNCGWQSAEDRRALLALLRETRDDITAVVNDSESQHPGGWGPDVTTVAFLRDVLTRLAALDSEVQA